MLGHCHFWENICEKIGITTVYNVYPLVNDSYTITQNSQLGKFSDHIEQESK